MINKYASIAFSQMNRKLSLKKHFLFQSQNTVYSFANFQQQLRKSPSSQNDFKSTNICFKSDGNLMYVYSLSPISNCIGENQFEVVAGSAIALTFYPDTSETLRQNWYQQRKTCFMNCKEVFEVLKMKPRSGYSLNQTNQLEKDGKIFTKTLSVSDLVDKKQIQIRVKKTFLKGSIEEMMWLIEFKLKYIDFKVLQQHFKENLAFISGAELMLELDKENELKYVDSIQLSSKKK